MTLRIQIATFKFRQYYNITESQFAEFYAHQSFPLYGIQYDVLHIGFIIDIIIVQVNFLSLKLILLV